MTQDQQKLEAARAEALKIAKQCYSMGTFGAWFEAAFSPRGKDFHTPEGRERIKDDCFHELAAPRLLSAGGSADDLARISRAARNR